MACIGALGAALPVILCHGRGGLPRGLDNANAPPQYAGARWASINRVLGLSLLAIIICAVGALPPLACTVKMRALQRSQQRLVFAELNHKLLVDAVCRGVDLTYHIAGVPVTPHVCVLVVAVAALPTAAAPALLQAAHRAFEAA